MPADLGSAVLGHQRRRATIVFVLVFALVATGLSIARQGPSLALGRAPALGAVLRDPEAAPLLRHSGWTRSEVVPIDSSVAQVNFYRGPQLVLEAAVRADGTVEQVSDSAHRAVPYGNAFAYRPAVLLGLATLFVLMTAVLPLRRIRNLDVAAMTSLVVPLVLIQHRYVTESMAAAALPLAYLGLRCAWLALAPARDDEPARPLFEAITASWSERERVRVLRTLVLAAGLAFLMVGISSPGPVDVVYAVMEGATKLARGILPYGHLPGDVIHGDTYPLLSYALFVPVAWLAPVNSLWDSVDLALAVGVLMALLAAVCAYLTTVAATGIRSGRAPHAERAGLRAVIGLLCFPPLLVIVSSGTTDVEMGALLMLAVALWRRPAASAMLLGIAGWFKLAPFALVPIWLAPRRGRRFARAACAIVAVSVLCLAAIVALGGTAGVLAMVRAISYQFSRGGFQSPWHALGADSLQPFGEAALAAFIVAAALLLRGSPGLAAEPRRMAALSAAILIGLQLTANYWAFLYLAWVAPLLMTSLLGQPAAEPAASPAAGRAEAPALVGPLTLGRV